MADQDQSVDILLRTKADSSGANQIERDLERVKGAAAGAGGEGEARETFALSEAAQGRLTAEERIASIIGQRQILVDLELEKTLALAAGETERVTALTADIELKTQALRLQVSAALSEEEALLIARQRIAAEAQIAAAQVAQAESSLLAGVSLSRARNEATTLARELATGTVNMRTVSALAGSLGATLGVGAIGGLVVAGIIGEIGKKLDAGRITAEKESVEFEKQAEHWRAMAASVKDFSDVQKLTEEVARRVSEYQEKARQLPSEVGEGFWTTELNGLKLVADFFGGNFKTSTDKAIQQERELADQIAATGKIYVDLAKRRADYIKAISELSLSKEIETLKAKIDELVASQSVLDRTNAGQARQWERLQVDVDSYTKILDGLQKKQEQIAKTSESLNSEIKKLTFDDLDKPGQLAALATDLESVRTKLHDLGVEAAGPAQALAAVGSEVSEHANKIKALIVDWEKLTAEQDKINEKLAEEAKRRGEVAQKIREEITALQLKQKDLQLEFQLTTDPAKKAAIQQEQEQLNLKLLVEQKIKDAADAAGRAGQEWTDKQSNLLRNQLTPALERELSILQKLTVADPFGGWQAKIDALVGSVNKLNFVIAKAPSGDIADRWKDSGPGSFTDRWSQPAPGQNQQEVETLKAAEKQAAEEVAKSVTNIGTAMKDGLATIQTAAETVPGKITPLFAPVANSIQTEIPKAIEAGLTLQNEAIAKSLAGITETFRRSTDKLWEQIARLWENS